MTITIKCSAIKTEVCSIHTDYLGTPKQITNQNKEVVWSIEMDTFGEVKPIDSKNGFEFNLRFAGQYFDTETGYHYNYDRYYDPSLGRCLTSDPIGLAGGLNTYGYVENRPWMANDVYGLYAVGIWDGKQGLDIIIPILFTQRANEFQDKIMHWKNVVEKVYTGRFGEFDVRTKIDLLSDDINHTYNHINTVAVKYDTECDTSKESCNNHLKNNEKINRGTFFLSASDSTISHEFGHILGIDFDPYFTQPYIDPFSRWHNVMGNSLSYSHADWLMFSVIFDSRAFEWQDGCKPDFEKYDHMLDAQDFLRKSQELEKQSVKP